MSKRQSVIDEGFEAGGMAAAKVGLAFTVAGIKQFCARSLSLSLLACFVSCSFLLHTALVHSTFEQSSACACCNAHSGAFDSSGSDLHHTPTIQNMNMT